jgi:hypothetical protein
MAGALIQVTQRVSARAMAIGSRWTHAAVYLGSGLVVDATIGGGVQSQSLWPYVQYRSITVRRLDDPALPNAGPRIAMAAHGHIGKPYAAIQAVLAKLGWPPSMVPNPESLFCSTLVGLAVAEATNVALWADPQFQPLFPGAIAAHADLQRVQLHWRNI